MLKYGDKPVPIPISALERRPSDLIREVSPEAITFFVDDLSGIYLPDDFKRTHADVFDVKYWKPEDRLRGKFGRFTIAASQENDSEQQLDDIVIMGTAIGLRGFDRYRNLLSLRHYMLHEGVRDALGSRGLLNQGVKVNPVDYGATTIRLGSDNAVESFGVGGSSIDFGRAKAEGRQRTCGVFAELIGNEIQVTNDDPEPREDELIVS